MLTLFSQFRPAISFGIIAVLSIILASCSGSSSNNTETLRIYETIASSGKFTAVAGDSTGTNFQLTLGNVPKDILWFNDRPGQDAGYDTVSNVITNIWPRVYGTVAPNALLKGTIANQGYIEIFCVLNKPVYNVTTGQLDFTITYLDGNQKPVSDLAITDVKLIILNNAITQAEEWSQLLAGDIGTFEPTATAGTYTFRIQKTIGDVFSYTGAPAQKMSRVSVKAFIQSWQTRFGTNSPNVSIAYNPQNNITGGVQIATLTNPVYDESTGSLSFTAKILYGTMPISNGMTVNGPSLFIDAGSGDYIDFPKDVSDIPGETVFAIQYRNSTTEKISVILVGSKPPCSKDQAVAGKCDTSQGLDKDGKWVDDSNAWAAKWTNMSSAFKASGTKFYKLTPTSKGSYTAKATPVATKTDLEKNQILRIVLPLVDKIPQWYYTGWKQNSATKWEQLPISSGITTWVTPITNTMMMAAEKVMLFEFFPCSGQIYNDEKKKFETADKKLWFNLSAVDGVNARVTMKYGGQSLKSDANLEPYSDTNPDGCPYSEVYPTFNTLTCVSPKHYPEDADLGRIDGQLTKRTLTGTDGIDVTLQIPSWVVGSDKFTQADVNAAKYKVVTVQDSEGGSYITYQDFYNKYASTTTGLKLAAAASANKFDKAAYHIWWSTNSVGQAWLKYLQGNKKSDAYGWAYDEQKWIPGKELKFDFNGNPGKNTDPDALRSSDYAAKDGYLNIDILQVMK